MLGNRDSLDIRDGNNVNCDIDNLTNRYSDRADEAVKSEDRQRKTLAVLSTIENCIKCIKKRIKDKTL